MLVPLWKPAEAWMAGLRAVHCAHTDCRRWVTQRVLETRRVGVRIEGAWFCSWVCATRRITARLTELAASDGALGHAPRMPLGMLLVQRGCLSYQQFREAEECERATGVEIGEALVQLGFCEEKDVLAARAAQWGCPVFAPAHKPNVVDVQIPITLLKTYEMVPVHYVPTARKLLMGFLHRTEYSALYAVEQVTGCATKVCFITPADFLLQMELQERIHSNAPPDVMIGDYGNIQGVATKIVVCGSDLGVDTAVFARTPHFVWARVTDGLCTKDVLFRVGTQRRR